MTGTHHGGSPARQPFNGGQRSTNTEIVRDFAGIIWSMHRDIEISTDKNTFARNVTEVLKYWDTRHMQRLLSYVQCKIDETV
jgi:hypothetical protein